MLRYLRFFTDFYLFKSTDIQIHWPASYLFTDQLNKMLKPYRKPVKDDFLNTEKSQEELIRALISISSYQYPSLDMSLCSSPFLPASLWSSYPLKTNTRLIICSYWEKTHQPPRHIWINPTLQTDCWIPPQQQETVLADTKSGFLAYRKHPCLADYISLITLGKHSHSLGWFRKI